MNYQQAPFEDNDEQVQAEVRAKRGSTWRVLILLALGAALVGCEALIKAAPGGIAQRFKKPTPTVVVATAAAQAPTLALPGQASAPVTASAVVTPSLAAVSVAVQAAAAGAPTVHPYLVKPANWPTDWPWPPKR